MTLQTHSERRLTVEGTYNIRDIGGYKTLNNGYTRWGTLFRADSLHQLTPESQKALLEFGIKTFIDLRQPYEVKNSPNVFATVPHVKYLNIPLLGEEDGYSIAKLSQTLLEVNCRILDRCQRSIQSILTAIITDQKPVLIHCTIGKDRTGIIIALLLSMAKVSKAIIAEDYALSKQFLAPLVEEWMREAAVAGTDISRLRLMLDAQPETMLDTLYYLDWQYGGAVNYLRTIGLSEEQISELGTLLIEPYS